MGSHNGSQRLECPDSQISSGCLQVERKATGPTTGKCPYHGFPWSLPLCPLVIALLPPGHCRYAPCLAPPGHCLWAPSLLLWCPWSLLWWPLVIALVPPGHCLGAPWSLPWCLLVVALVCVYEPSLHFQSWRGFYKWCFL